MSSPASSSGCTWRPAMDTSSTAPGTGSPSPWTGASAWTLRSWPREPGPSKGPVLSLSKERSDGNGKQEDLSPPAGLGVRPQQVHRLSDLLRGLQSPLDRRRRRHGADVVD